MNLRKAAYNLGNIVSKLSEAVHMFRKAPAPMNPFLPAYSDLYGQDIPLGLIDSGIEALPFNQGVRVLELYAAVQPLVEYQRAKSRQMANRYMISEERIPIMLENEDEDAQPVLQERKFYNENHTPNFNTIDYLLKNMNLSVIGRYFGKDESFGAKLVRDAILLTSDKTRGIAVSVPSERRADVLPRLELSSICLDYL